MPWHETVKKTKQPDYNQCKMKFSFILFHMGCIVGKAPVPQDVSKRKIVSHLGGGGMDLRIHSYTLLKNLKLNYKFLHILFFYYFPLLIYLLLRISTTIKIHRRNNNVFPFFHFSFFIVIPSVFIALRLYLFYLTTFVGVVLRVVLSSVSCCPVSINMSTYTCWVQLIPSLFMAAIILILHINLPIFHSS